MQQPREEGTFYGATQTKVCRGWEPTKAAVGKSEQHLAYHQSTTCCVWFWAVAGVCVSLLSTKITLRLHPWSRPKQKIVRCACVCGTLKCSETQFLGLLNTDMQQGWQHKVKLFEIQTVPVISVVEREGAGGPHKRTGTERPGREAKVWGERRTKEDSDSTVIQKKKKKIQLFLQPIFNTH